MIFFMFYKSCENIIKMQNFYFVVKNDVLYFLLQPNFKILQIRKKLKTNCSKSVKFMVTTFLFFLKQKAFLNL